MCKNVCKPHIFRGNKFFLGAVIVISHNAEFVGRVCNEIWEMKDGKMTIAKMKDSEKK